MERFYPMERFYLDLDRNEPIPELKNMHLDSLMMIHVDVWHRNNEEAEGWEAFWAKMFDTIERCEERFDGEKLVMLSAALRIDSELPPGGRRILVRICNVGMGEEED